PSGPRFEGPKPVPKTATSIGARVWACPCQPGATSPSCRRAKHRAGVNMINRQVVLVSRPTGVAQAENFAIREAPVVPPREGQLLVRNEFLSVEPAMRGWIADQGNYSASVAIGSVMRALAVGEVVESRHPDFRA